MEHWFAKFGVLSIVLTDNGTQFTSNFFIALCEKLHVETVVTTEYHVLLGEQVERFNVTRDLRLRYDLAEHLKDWDMFELSVTHACNVQVHQITKLPLLSLEITWLLPGPADVACPMPPNVSKNESRLAYRLHFVDKTASRSKDEGQDLQEGAGTIQNRLWYGRRFEQCFEAGDYFLIDSLPLIILAADRMAYEGYSNVLAFCSGPYQIISTEPEYTKIDQTVCERVALSYPLLIECCIHHFRYDWWLQ